MLRSTFCCCARTYASLYQEKPPSSLGSSTPTNSSCICSRGLSSNETSDSGPVACTVPAASSALGTGGLVTMVPGITSFSSAWFAIPRAIRVKRFGVVTSPETPTRRRGLSETTLLRSVKKPRMPGAGAKARFFIAVNRASVGSVLSSSLGKSYLICIQQRPLSPHP